MSTAKRQSTERTARGFRIFGRVPNREGGTVRVQESSLAFEGAHVRLLLDDVACKQHLGEHMRPDAHLGVVQAVALIAALQAFVDEARAGELTEGARRRS